MSETRECVAHHNACDCREFLHEQDIKKLTADLDSCKRSLAESEKISRVYRDRAVAAEGRLAEAEKEQNESYAKISELKAERETLENRLFYTTKRAESAEARHHEARHDLEEVGKVRVGQEEKLSAAQRALLEKDAALRLAHKEFLRLHKEEGCGWEGQDQDPCICQKEIPALEKALALRPAEPAERVNFDPACLHGRAFDMHCCECERNGFFPPANCPGHPCSTKLINSSSTKPTMPDSTHGAKSDERPPSLPEGRAGKEKS